MTRADRILLAVLIAVAALAVPATALGVRGQHAAYLSGPSGVTQVDLAHDATYRIDGRLGEVVFTVREGSLRCVSSGCPDQICVRAGVARPGAPIICAPNGVIAEFTGENGGGVDAISR